MIIILGIILQSCGAPNLAASPVPDGLVARERPHRRRGVGANVKIYIILYY